ncbi:EamA domain [Dillenia turbinata]|uniref:WAT1-related protein n=1 Tax=Dillenia turbinata TaxID=194707 RepID=A0AAN8ZLA5_9MAGN
MERKWVASALEESLPYAVLTLYELSLAIFMILVQYVASDGVSTVAIVVYEHILSTIVLSILAFFLERNKRPPLSLVVVGHAFLLGLLQVTFCQLLLTLALQYVASTYESIALNLVPTIVFVLALIFQQEKLEVWSINGQAKMWGLLVSVAGALTMVLWTGPTVLSSASLHSTSDGVIGGTMIVIGVLGTCFWNVLVKHVVQIYPAELSLTAMMSMFGTIQTSILAAFLISTSSWKLEWDGGVVLSTILLGGIAVTGLGYYASTWTIKKKGPVFTSAFNPLLVLFSFLLETFVLGSSAHWGSIVGGVLVIIGLYMLLWAKVNDTKEVTAIEDVMDSPLLQT